MQAKTPAKKTKSAQKSVRKTAGKAPKKVTWDDIEAGFDRLQKSQDEAWKAIRETQQANKETDKTIIGARKETEKTRKEAEKVRKEADKARKEAEKARKEADKSRDEAWKAIRETQQAVKETQKNIGGLNNTLGSLVERIMTPDLPRKFKPLGFTFDKITTVKLAADGYIYAEIDGLLENGVQAMAVEVKTTLDIKGINDHLKRMERIRKYADEHGDKREFLGAIAARVVKPKPRNYALEKGLFVIEPSGEDVKVIKPETEPRVW
jgi:hypothetical protein